MVRKTLGLIAVLSLLGCTTLGSLRADGSTRAGCRQNVLVENLAALKLCDVTFADDAETECKGIANLTKAGALLKCDALPAEAAAEGIPG